MIIWFSFYPTFIDLLTKEFRFTTFPLFIISLVLLGVFLPVNMILFYLAHFTDSKIISSILRWLPIPNMILFFHWAFTIKEYVNATYAILMIFYIVSSTIVWIKQGNYFERWWQGKKP
jgi:hypothetical protein